MAIKYFDIPVHTYHRALVSSGQTDIPMVLIHAFPVDHHVWDKTAVELVRACEQQTNLPDTTILAVDMPGAGTNPVPDVRYVGDIADDGAYVEAMDRMASSIVHAVQSMGYHKAMYVGISMGGYATLSIVRQFPDAVAGLALCDTKADADTSEQRANRLESARRAEDEATLEPVFHFARPADGDSTFKKSSEYIDTFMQWISSQTPAGVAWRQRMAAGRRDDNDTLEKIHVPAAVISGSLDPSSAPHIMRPIAEAMSNASVRFTEIDDCGHFSSFEKPAQVAHALEQLIRDVYESQEATGASQTATHYSSPRLGLSPESLRMGEQLKNIPLASGAVNWNINSREKITREGWLEVLHDEHTFVVLVRNSRIALAKTGIQSAMQTGHMRRLVELAGSYVADTLSKYPDALYFLGQLLDEAHREQRTYVAVDMDALGDKATHNAVMNTFIQRALLQYDWPIFRQCAGLLSAHHAQLATMAQGLALWHSKARYCGYCGASTLNTNGGWAVQCTGTEQHIHFPRIEPSMIVRITDDSDRIVLQHNKAWDNNVYSVCSGFVEVGENVEHAVHREVQEELGILVDSLHYVGSQPWPFPGSLMLAYGARATDTRLTLDTREVADAQWFTRDEFMDALALGRIELPGRASIALRMIEQWYGTELR
ncbi:NAD(+) diphosphatase [Alloscardovia omnicolens]|uniref:NAD(+) diphosphatase n=1 Tax=Alloscardovia omnicolens TaxID=419015 RepID=UPI003A61C428